MSEFECCACRAELHVVRMVVEATSDYADHDDLCQLSKYRCNELSCEWCDLCDTGLVQPTASPHTQRSFYDFKSDSSEETPSTYVRGSSTGYPSRLLTSGWGSSWKDEKPKPPSADALDLLPSMTD